MIRKSNDLESNDRRQRRHTPRAGDTAHLPPDVQTADPSQRPLADGGVHDHGRDNVTFTQTAPDALLPPRPAVTRR